MTDTSSNSNSNSDGWRERARELHEEGGVPESRARIVALTERGHTNQQAADALGLNSRGYVWRQIDAYRTDRDTAEWLAEHGPDI